MMGWKESVRGEYILNDNIVMSDRCLELEVYGRVVHGVSNDLVTGDE